uniref:Small ribosomal subunit protein mS31 n=1 Tax=Daphnia magna TaxID=35525 RepID=A0A4Y7MFK5_9CRUS|nr:EOG090X04UC [Daphnia magna]
MKLSLMFIVGCITASLSYGQPPFQWQQMRPASRNRQFMTLIDFRNSDADNVIADNDHWDSADEPLWRQEDGGVPHLRQYHHNENVNQFYYPMSPSFLPTPVRDHGRISSRQKTRPFIRPSTPSDSTDMMANNARFFASFPNLFFPSMFYSYLSSISTSAYSTSTSYLILNSTLTTTLITSCIPISSFSAATLANVACRRKRHLMDEAVEAGDDELGVLQGPNYLSNEEEQWMDSSLVNSLGRTVDPEILSSKETEVTEPEMLQAVEDVSNMLSQEKEALKNSLIAKLEDVADESERARLEPFKPNKQKTEDLNSLLNTLKVDGKKPKNKSPAPKLAPVKIEDIYGAQPSGIFSKAHFIEESSAVSGLATWDMLYEKELELAVTHPPANGFQQMIQWTKQGKVWQFPIDNEQGLDEEARVGFHEHVFLEPHLKPWCPRRGPVRHFMELVVVGLSKNPYLTVEQKKEHINWFRDFFEAKRSILIDTGAIPDITTKSSPSLST